MDYNIHEPLRAMAASESETNRFMLKFENELVKLS